jgi:hypothetical protein
MKRTIMLLVAGFVALLLSACSTVQLKPVSIPVIPPAQLAQQVCPIVKADLDVLTSAVGLAILSPAQQSTVVTSIQPKFNAACSAAAAVDLADLQSFNADAFPALIAIVAAVPAIPNQPAVLLGLQLAQPIVQAVVTNAAAASKASAAAAASGSTPLSSAPIQ